MQHTRELTKLLVTTDGGILCPVVTIQYACIKLILDITAFKQITSTQLIILFNRERTDFEQEQMESSGTNNLYDIEAAWTALGIIHISIVVVPTLVFGITILVLLRRLAMISGVNPIIVLYSTVAIFCNLGTLSYSLLGDVSLVTGIPILGNCTSYPVGSIQFVVRFCFETVLTLTIAVIAIFQFLILHYGHERITSKMAIIVFFVVTAISLMVGTVFLASPLVEIRGSHCTVSDRDMNAIGTAVWIVIGYGIPLVLTVVFSALICSKVKKDVSTQRNSIVSSVVTVNIINISVYVIFRLSSTFMYFIFLVKIQQEQLLNVLTVVSRYFNDITYPAALFSILIVHKGLRGLIFKRRLSTPALT